MSVRRIGTKKTLPSDPTWVEVPRTDADPKNWPANTQKVVDSDGHVNFMRPVSIDESVSIAWRLQLGPRVAAALGLPCEYVNLLDSMCSTDERKYSWTNVCPEGLAGRLPYV